MIINKGFQRKRQQNIKLPPGQYETKNFPVLSLGPTPHIDLKDWQLMADGLVENSMIWNWEEFSRLPHESVVKDIHCVTKWSKFDTNWSGVLLDEIISIVKIKPEATHLIAYSYDGYSTNIPLKDVVNGLGMVATAYDSKPIEPQHGGPARLLIPHLYFWKSAKWVMHLQFTNQDMPGFWETRGYHNYGDPWKEQRYTYDE